MAYLSAKLNNIISNNILLNRVVACVNDVFEIDNCKGELSELSLLYGTFCNYIFQQQKKQKCPAQPHFFDGKNKRNSPGQKKKGRKIYEMYKKTL